MRPLVGLLHPFIPSAEQTVGIGAAVQGLARALNAHGERFRYELYCDPRALALARQALSPLAEHLSVASQAELARRPDAPRFTAWHDSGLDAVPAFALRARSGRAYPVSLLHHSLSYKGLLQDTFPAVLLSRPRPHDSIVCTSKAARGVLENVLAHVAERFERALGLDLSYQGRFDDIPLGVDTWRFRPGDRAAARAGAGLAPDALMLLWVGRLTPIDKADLMPLLLVFRELLRRNPGRPLSLVLVGRQRPGERFGDRLRAFAGALGIGDSVTLMTEVTEALPALYQAADVFVSPVDSVQESFGLAPLEAMASGLPQVVSDWSGYRDTVVDGETGFLIPTLWSAAARDVDEGALLSDSAFDHLALAQSVVVDPRCLTDRLQQLIGDPGLRAAMSEASRRRACERFAWEQVVKCYESLWSELATLCAAAAGDAAPPPVFVPPRYFDHFRHLATRTLPGDALVSLTPLGRDWSWRTDEELPPLGAGWGHLERELLVAVHGYLGSVAEGGRHPTVVALTRACADAAQVEPARIERHLLWLLKYGLVSVTS